MIQELCRAHRAYDNDFGSLVVLILGPFQWCSISNSDLVLENLCVRSQLDGKYLGEGKNDEKLWDCKYGDATLLMDTCTLEFNDCL